VVHFSAGVGFRKQGSVD